MKAVHVSWGVILVGLGVLLTQGGGYLQGHALDWVAIGTALSAIVGAITPAAQLGLAGYKPAAVPGDMPVAK
jgi:hypothetical protein